MRGRRSLRDASPRGASSRTTPRQDISPGTPGACPCSRIPSCSVRLHGPSPLLPPLFRMHHHLILIVRFGTDRNCWDYAGGPKPFTAIPDSRTGALFFPAGIPSGSQGLTPTISTRSESILGADRVGSDETHREGMADNHLDCVGTDKIPFIQAEEAFRTSQSTVRRTCKTSLSHYRQHEHSAEQRPMLLRSHCI